MNAHHPVRRSHPAPLLMLGFVLLALVVVMSVLFTAKERATNQYVQTALLTEDRLEDTLSTMREAENGVRGYLLTGNPISLHTYNLAIAASPRNLAALDAVLAGSPDAAQLAEVHQMVRDKFSQLAQAMALAQSGQQAAAAALINTDLNLGTMVNLRAAIGQMRDDEEQRLEAAEAQAGHQGFVLQTATALAVLATLLLAWFAIRANAAQTGRLVAAEAALLAANETLEQKLGDLDRIFNLSTDILAVNSFERQFIAISPAWERITGRPVSEALDAHIAEYLHPDDRALSAEAHAKVITGQPVALVNRYRRADGSWCWLSWRAVPVMEQRLVYGVARDITAERDREEQLRQSQKMEVVGQLTGGVAHDFNNLLTIIMGSLELLQRGLAGADPRTIRRADSAMDAAKRAATLTHRLLAFSRRQPLEPKSLDANRLLAGMSDMLHRTLGETVAVEIIGAAGLWPALADANQLENAVLNLAVNARDAMPGGGHLSIETQNTYLDDGYAAAHVDVEAGQYVMIAVTDTGQGMSREIQAKVFEPFFTTKPQGQGTGLGLAQVYGFIKQSGGHISVYSEPGEGTCVKLYLPRLRGAAPAGEPEHELVLEEHPGNGERVLVVEDEAGVRNFTAEVLAELGYEVLTASDASSALTQFESVPGIKMLFTDVVLSGGLNGRQLADAVLRRRPDVIVLFTTGYTRNAIMHHGRLDEGIHFIGKPFTAAALGAKVARLFEAARTEKV